MKTARIRPTIAGALFSFTLLSSTASADGIPTPGRYGPLAVAIRDGTVYGVFSETRIGNGTDDAPQFSCIFLLRGPLVGGKASVQTWFPGDKDRIPGILDVGGSPSLKLEADQPGCAMASGPMVSEPYSLMLDARHDEWIGVGVVTAQKAVLRKDAIKDPKRKTPYLVEFDPVAVLDRRPGWVRVQYLGENDKVTGWMREDENSTAPGMQQ